MHSLGVLLDLQLILDGQVTALAKVAFAQLWLMHQLRPYRSLSDQATVVHALVTSCLDYSNALYVRLPLRTVRKLQLVQNGVAHVAQLIDSIGSLLQQLH